MTSSVNFGGTGYVAPETHVLTTIAKTPTPDLSDSQKQAEFLQGLQSQVQFLASNQSKIQKDVTQATQNPLKQLQQFVADIVVLFGGGELVAGVVDFGDLQYILPALGALFGFGDGPFPLNLIAAAERFFLGYVVPTQQFTDTIIHIIDGWAALLGIDKKFVSDVNKLITAVGELFDGLTGLLPNVQEFFNALNITAAGLGPLGVALAPILALFESIDISKFGNAIEFITDAIDPFIVQLTALINFLNEFIAVFGFAGDVINSPVSAMVAPFKNLMRMLGSVEFAVESFNPFTAAQQFFGRFLIPISGITQVLPDLQIDSSFDNAASIGDGSPAWDTGGDTAWAWDIVGHAGDGSAKLTPDSHNHILLGTEIPVVEGQTFTIDCWISWDSLVAGGTPFNLQVVTDTAAVTDIGSITTPDVSADWTHLSGGWTAPGGVATVRTRLFVGSTAISGEVWFDDAPIHRTNLLPKSLVDELVDDLETIFTNFATLLDGILGTGHTFEDLAAALSVGLDQAATAIDNFNSILTGMGLTVIGDLVALLNTIVNGWHTVLGRLKLADPLALIQQLPQSIPAFVRDAEGALTAVGTGFTKDAEGAITFASDGLTHLVKQADGAILSLQQVAAQIVHATSVIGNSPVNTAAGAVKNPGVADVLNAGQTAHTALTGAIEQAGATVENDIVAGAAQFGGVVSGTIGQIEDAAKVFAGDVAAGVDNLGAQAASWMSLMAAYWTGSPPPPPPPGPPAPSQAMLDAAAAAAAAQALAAQQTAAIKAQLPHFYGGSGVAGTNIEQSFSGLTSLPAGFAPVTTIAAVSAMYSTAAQTSSQTTSEIWSTSDQYAKYLFLRMKTAGASYVYAKIQNNVPFTGAGNCEIGCVVAGTRHVFITFALPSTGNLVSNNVYTFEAAGNVFQLTGPGGLNESCIDGISGGPPSVSQWDPDNTTHVYGYGGWGTDGTLLSQQAFTSPATYNVPPGMVSGDIFDVAEIGGGGGGNEDDGAGHLRGGGLAGNWSVQRLIWGTDFSTVTTTFAITPGDRGAGALSPNALPGGNSTVAIAGWGSSPLTATGGGTTSAGGTTVGATASNETFQNAGYVGGAGSAAIGTPGAVPGGGGFGAGIAFTDGGAGKIWVNACSLNIVGSLYSWAFYDSGPSTGPGGAVVDTDETTASPTYVQLATTTDQIDVNITDRGMAQVFLGAEFYNTISPHYAYVSFGLSGANNVTAATMESLGKFIKNGSNTAKFGEPFMVYNLDPGPTTFDMEFRTDGTGTGHFANRSIDVIPL